MFIIEDEVRVVTSMGTKIESKITLLDGVDEALMLTVMESASRSMYEYAAADKSATHDVTDDEYGLHYEVADTYNTADGRRMIHIIRAIEK